MYSLLEFYLLIQKYILVDKYFNNQNRCTFKNISYLNGFKSISLQMSLIWLKY